MDTLSKINALRAAWLEGCAAEFDRKLAATESPIEALFLAHLVSVERFESAGGVVHSCLERCLTLADNVSRWFSCDGVHLVTQAIVPLSDRRRPRVDFAFVHELGGRPVAVELDGHAFHERTKEQASRDKKRDRDLVSAGWNVLRFTGSEVHASPASVWQCVDDMLWHGARAVG